MCTSGRSASEATPASLLLTFTLTFPAVTSIPLGGFYSEDPLVLLGMFYKQSVRVRVRSRGMTPTLTPLLTEESYKQDSSQWYKSPSSLCLQYYMSTPQGLPGLRIYPRRNLSPDEIMTFSSSR